jgi:N utilization substance protein A
MELSNKKLKVLELQKEEEKKETFEEFKEVLQNKGGFISAHWDGTPETEQKIKDETKRAEVFLKLEEVSKAIGRGGHNIKLAGLLTGYELDVIREGNIAEEEDDVELREFSDEIEAWIIEEFEKIGLDTARSVLKQEVSDLVRRTDLEEETIIDVMNVLKEELEG